MSSVGSRGEIPGAGKSRSLRVGDWVYQRLREGIILGDFQPGERLRQSDVAERFEVSQTPVREALGRLAADGLVTLQPHRGAVVNSLSSREIDEIYQCRELIDPYVARLAAESASPAQVKAIHAAAEACAEPGIGPTELFERNRGFHLAIYEACGNRRMTQFFRLLWDSVTAIRMFDAYATDQRALDKMTAEHRAIASAIAAGDAATAADLVLDHTVDARRDVLGLIPPDGSDETEESS